MEKWSVLCPPPRYHTSLDQCEEHEFASSAHTFSCSVFLENFAAVYSYLHQRKNNPPSNVASNSYTSSSFVFHWSTYSKNTSRPCLWMVFLLTWWDGHVGIQTNSNISNKFCIMTGSNSHKTFSLLFFIPTWPAWRHVKTLHTKFELQYQRKISVVRAFFERRGGEQYLKPSASVHKQRNKGKSLKFACCRFI